ncbi:MAG: hypothetical protein JWN75_1179 [Candidatus Saccharibacteria bacterium]|nr:hypothetical protein [Candidatus Saccharibacteria bacterium]
MSNSDFKEGWGVIDTDGLSVKTVSPTRLGALVNWLVTEKQMMVTSSDTESFIEWSWDKIRGDAMIVQVRIYVQP